MKKLIALALSSLTLISTQAAADVLVICACGGGACDCLIIIMQ